ncbi:MAG: bifunctional D-glycero-beta-D-manno-heptose-7-phosphate kinase/D-glycero-beta-D-manno-heptose 1-phosphate adenylyltransferase HldE [Thermodesulfobacteriota bacterium]
MSLSCPDFSSCPVVVAGDLMLDLYYWGDVSRISPEAPVPVVRVTDKTHTLGGAGNVALNLAGLGCPVTLLGVRGDDGPGRMLVQMLAEKGIADATVTDPGHVTTTKTRVLSGNQQMMRLDEERLWQAADPAVELLVTGFEKAIAGARAVILSDYGKGLFAGGLAEVFIARCAAAKVPVFVDPKGTDWSRYARATCITPNTREFAQVCPSPVAGETEMEEQAGRLIDRLRLDFLLVTRGRKGMSLFGRAVPPVHIPTEAREVFDVSGAGDTAIATAAAAFGSGMAMSDAAVLANCAAGIVVQKVGTCPVTRVELEAALRSRQGAGVSKLFATADATKMIALWKAEKKRVVFTNGCFDLLHTGHVKLLHAAAAEGDKLVVGLNSDDSVRRLKGSLRPVLPEQERAALLGAIGCVDMVVIFSQDTPLDLISEIRPDVLVKGGDYTPDTVVGRDLVESYGGRVALVPLKDGMSTTRIIDAVYQKRNNGA